MANPRKVVQYEGINGVYVTMLIDASTITFDKTKAGGADATMIGKAVAMTTTDGVVKLTEDGEAVVGKLISVEPDGACTVQVGGFCTLPGGASATLTRGSTIVGALGASSAKGYIRTAASGTAAELIKARGRIIAASVTTAVVVQL